MKLQVCEAVNNIIEDKKAGQSIATCWGNQRKRKALAKELVRRWNAFEKDGLVDELLDACKECRATFIGLQEGSIGWQAMKKVNAAIAKVKA